MSPQDTIIYEKVTGLFMNNSSTIVMGILNITADSFFDGGQFTLEEKWLEQASRMIDEGASIIDVGAVSSRPGAMHISEEEEAERLIPAIRSIRNNFPNLLISADTFRASVSEKAVEAGANIINDISGGTLDPQLFQTVARLKVPYILTHIQGNPQNMQQNPIYINVVDEVFAYFEEKLKELNSLGVHQVILDPGFGFGKTLEHNYQLLKSMDKFMDLQKPILVGISRKSMITKLLNIKTKEAINGTTTLNTIALQKGAKLIRVHDVKEAMEVVKIVDYLKTI